MPDVDNCPWYAKYVAGCCTCLNFYIVAASGQELEGEFGCA